MIASPVDGDWNEFIKLEVVVQEHQNRLNSENFTGSHDFTDIFFRRKFILHPANSIGRSCEHFRHFFIGLSIP